MTKERFNSKMLDQSQTITITELTSHIKEELEGNFQQVFVSGEISNFKHHYSGHMYFTLKDDNAEIRVVMFKGFNQYLRFNPEDGMQVLAGGRISVYEQRGQYQLILKQMEPSGIGTLYLAFEALKKKLAEEGLFDEEKKLPLPIYPKTVGVITSKSGAAVQDIFQILERRAPFVNIILRPAKVQGDGAGDDIVQAINEFNKYGKVDVIIVGRGGGSLEDLWPFNEEVVVRAISVSLIPIISAVGHETDYSISDMVADLRAPTPSAAAEVVSLSVNDITEKLNGYQSRIESIVQHRLEKHWQTVDNLTGRHLQLRPDKIIERQSNSLNQLKKQLIRVLTIEKQKERLYITNSILDKSIESLRKSISSKFDTISGKLSALNPTAILERGYSVAFTLPDRKIIKTTKDIEIGKDFELQTAKGRLKACKTEEIKE